MAEELTPSEYEKLVASGKTGKASRPAYIKPVIVIAAVILLCGGSFLLGESYQKNHSSATAANGQAGFQGRGGSGGRQIRGTIGAVTAISSDSITVKNARSGSSETYKITGSTVFENNGSAASVSDIKTGDTVFVRTDTNDDSTASRILLNPEMGQGPQDGGQSQSDQSGTLSN